LLTHFFQTSQISVAEDSSIAAFAITDQTSPDSQTKTRVVYLDPNKVMRYSIWNGVQWSEPATDDALTGADNGTDITCLTEGIWEDLEPLKPKTDMSRCYFQSGE
jgi:hypothetical protein